MQGRRNSIISGEATSNIAYFLHFFPKKLVCQPLISGEAAASPASPVPTPLKIFFWMISISIVVSQRGKNLMNHKVLI